ncbi:MAG: adenosine deaminase [Acidobacteria bacterium]|nr:adenosine deaminase [Acidobacteriota bacterium]
MLMFRAKRCQLLCFSLMVCAAFAAPARAQKAATPEARAAKAYESARMEGPPALRTFLHEMPKGADLHMHLSGAVYAETLLKDAAEDGMCVNVAALALDKRHHAPECGSGEVAAGAVAGDQHLYDELIDSFSMRTFVPVAGDSGHDHFFDTFAKFGGTDKRHLGEWIDEVATRAAAQNEQYLELMNTPDFSAAAALAVKDGFDPDFRRYRARLLADGIDKSLPSIRQQLDEAEADRREREHCGQKDAQAACKVEVRYLFQVLRGQPKESVFAQVVLAFELAKADPRVVGMNFVMPEDCYVCMHDYRLQMSMLDALHGLYPQVHISLHAGELTEGLVPPDGLRFHIRSAVEQGHAERIGHGVDVTYEDRADDLLKEMAAKHILVEINLTSNDVILNVAGRDHPLPVYLRYHVPVALSTDDEGVSRIDLTHEFVRAAATYSLSYGEMKQMVRASVEHSFLPGESLWQRSTPERLDRPVAACRGQLGNEHAAGGCARLLADSEKAAQEWELERRFRVFEGSF